MDLLQEIRKKILALTGDASLDGVNAVIRHVEVAERYFSRARDEREEDLFNDVIYRTNQAFEGMLKEAYTVLASNDGAKLSPHQIEQHLLQESVLTARVLDLFKNYRQQWRNPSTHDHNLFFSEQEALLAIVSVSAFANILLDQIIEVINFKREQEEVQRFRGKIQQVLQGAESKPLHEQLVALLKLFSSDLVSSITDLTHITEAEIIGRVHGFLESTGIEGVIKREYSITSGLVKVGQHLRSRFRPDLYVMKGAEEVVIEVKRPGFNKSVVESGQLQVLRYLEGLNLRHGILYLPPVTNEQMESITTEYQTGDGVVWVHAIAPTSIR